MRYTKWLVAVGALLVLTVPQVIYASTLGSSWPTWARNAIGVGSLVVSVVLMLDVIALRRVAHGGAISENISYLVLGVVCLATSVLAGWAEMFLPMGVSADQARLAADGLTLLAMILLSLYFYRVRSALVGYLKAAQAYAQDAAPSDSEDGSGA